MPNERTHDPDVDLRELADVDDVFDERFTHGFDPIVFPPVVERLERICRVVIGETPEAEQAKVLGDQHWLAAETTSMVTLLQEAMRQRLEDLDQPTAPKAGA